MQKKRKRGRPRIIRPEETDADVGAIDNTKTLNNDGNISGDAIMVTNLLRKHN